MATAILFSLVSDISGRLASSAVAEIQLWRGANEDLKKLGKTMMTLQAVLVGAESTAVEKETQEWLNQLREALYEVDDLLDGCHAAVPGTSKACACLPNPGTVLQQPRLAYKIQRLTKTLESIAFQRRFLQVRPPETKVPSVLTHSSVPKVVVGREAEKRAVIEVLFQPCHPDILIVTCILGIGGQGKTTLAQLAFNDPAVVNWFAVRIWVCVADAFDVKTVVMKMLEAITRQKCASLEMEPLKDLLYEQINGKRCLLVLDDVWCADHDTWSRLYDLLVGVGDGSRIIITTRLEDVADASRGVSLKLQGLPAGESWNLFRQMAFPNGEVASDRHEMVGKEIVAKCAGVPLAIKATGRLLFYKDSIEKWLAFRDSELPKIDQRGMDILPILKLSYDHLPPHLKRCFAYCGLFPKGFTFDVHLLCSQWTAQGFVDSSLDLHGCREDAALSCFHDLLARLFFQEVEEGAWGAIRTAKMHDLMYYLCKQVSETELVEQGCIRSSKLHLSLTLASKTPNISKKIIAKGGKARSFVLLRKPDEDPDSADKVDDDQCRRIISSFPRLRVLGMRRLSLGMIPPSIGKLKHLRFLDLSGNEDLAALPDSITDLWHLQVLLLDYCSALRELPKDINRLVNLSQLGLEECSSLTHMPKGIGELSSLYTLSRFAVAISKYKGGLDELRSLNNLRGKMTISNLQNVNAPETECMAACMQEKLYLQHIVLKWGVRSINQISEEQTLTALQPNKNLKGLTVARYGGNVFPRWICGLTKLVKVAIYGCQNLQHVPPLHQLPSIKQLRIESLKAMEFVDVEIYNPSSSFYSCLETLQIWNCPNLKGWWKADHVPQFPSLSHLVIGGCPKLTSLPLSPPLKTIALWETDLKSLKSMISTSSPDTKTGSLQYLQIGDIADLENFPDEMLPRLAAIKTLLVADCPKLITLNKALHHMPSLEELWIWGCPNLNIVEVNQWNWPTALRRLFLRDFPLLESLPSWIQDNSSLEELRIWECPKLAEVPSWLSDLTSLRVFNIYDCPLLSRRFENTLGEDWGTVCEIPNIKIDGLTIKSWGRYHHPNQRRVAESVPRIRQSPFFSPHESSSAKFSPCNERL